MAKDLNNVVKITSVDKGDFSPILNALDSGKTILLAVKKGELTSSSLENGRIELLNAYCEFKETSENCGICGCGETADTLIYIWR